MTENKDSKRHPHLPLITRLKLLCIWLFNIIHIRLDSTTVPASAAKRVNRTVISSSDVRVDPSRNLWFRLFSPIPAHPDKSLPLIVYFHGGGFADYAPDSTHYDNLCRHLSAKTPAVVASVSYRHSPRHKHPAPYDDGFDALKFIDDRSYAVLPPCADLEKSFIMGDSAGGNIAHHVTVRALQNAREFERMKVNGLIGVQPFFGGEERTGSELRLRRGLVIDTRRTDLMWRNFLPEGADRNHPAAHVFGGPDSDAAGIVEGLDFPRTLVVAGGFDPLRDWDRRYAEGLRSCGKEVEFVEYPNAFHGFYGFPETAEFRLLCSDVASFIGLNRPKGEF